ncbi:hypothetical protein ACLEPN_30560 [Myxococcus sp. 1LA]
MSSRPLPAQAALMFAAKACARAITREIEAGIPSMASAHSAEHLAQIRGWMTAFASSLMGFAQGRGVVRERTQGASPLQLQVMERLVGLCERADAMEAGPGTPAQPANGGTDEA